MGGLGPAPLRPLEAASTGRAFELADYVAVRTHLGSVVRCHRRGIHSEAVAMLCNRHDVTGAGFDEEINPGVGVEVFGSEKWYEVLVAEFF
jgi:hypothetical protein